MDNMTKAVKQYNDLMFDIAREYNTIGTSYTEDPESRNNWNLRDLVSEVQYTLDVFEDPGCIYWQDAHDESQPSDQSWLKEWQDNIATMKRFIARYKDEAMTMSCYEGHSSKYD